MARAGLSLKKVKAIFVSHEHHDHIRGIPVLARKYQIPVYINTRTLQHGSLTLDPHLVRHFSNYDDIAVGGLSITAFPKFHDAADPCSFIVSGNKVRVGIFTDIGFPCEHVIAHFKQCHAAFLEANYDSLMLANGNYPYHLKRRITGGRGHLSNMQAVEVFKTHKPEYMSHVFLSHLSKDNNCPDLVKSIFAGCAGSTKVVVASRYQETEVYEIAASATESKILNHTFGESEFFQYSLF
jgi:phosphoribosyl 1,2-cyclic phosphodiesterase